MTEKWLCPECGSIKLSPIVNGEGTCYSCGYEGEINYEIIEDEE